MSSFKEIVTKAVIGKAKKTNNANFLLTPEEKPNTILGCWVINHSFNGLKGQNGHLMLTSGTHLMMIKKLQLQQKTFRIVTR